MKIVVLDGYTLNPGDLSWKDLEELGELTVYDRTQPGQLVPRAADAEVVLTNKTVIGDEHFQQLPKLKFIAVLATGYNVVDVEAARRRGIPVSNVPAYGTRSVAQMVFAHLLNLTQHVRDHVETVRRGRWSQIEDFCYWDYPLVELDGLVMGLVGLGRIGRAAAGLAAAFGMRVLAYDVAAVDRPDGVQMVDLDTLFQQSDVVSLHCPLTPENHGLVNARRLAMMKPTAFLINTSRGPLVDEQALAEALQSGRIAAAGLDVLAVEPPPPDHPLLQLENCYVTPHIAWATKSARQRLMNIAIENVRAMLRGQPQNVVNP